MAACPRQPLALAARRLFQETSSPFSSWPRWVLLVPPEGEFRQPVGREPLSILHPTAACQDRQQQAEMLQEESPPAGILGEGNHPAETRRQSHGNAAPAARREEEEWGALVPPPGWEAQPHTGLRPAAGASRGLAVPGVASPGWLRGLHSSEAQEFCLALGQGRGAGTSEPH